MNQKIYKIKSDIRLFLEEIKEDTNLVYQSVMVKNKPIDKDTIKYYLLDVEETIEVISNLFGELESEYENEQL